MKASSSERRCIIVAGFPRSGTSWLAKGLSFAPGFTYYREPDNYEHVPEAEKRFRYLYLTGEHDDPIYRQLMTRACSGQAATWFTMRQDPGPVLRFLGKRGGRLGERYPFLFFRKRHSLVKLVYASLNMAWFSANLPRAQQIYVMRHPCGQFESWKRLGWEPKPEMLLGNPRLVADHLHPFVDLIRSATSYWERAGALWAATVYVVHRQTRTQGGRLIIPYEWLCGDPVVRFESLYRLLGLTWNARAERFIRESDKEDDYRHYSMIRPTAKQVDKWKGRLTPEDIERCRRYVEPFGLPYYPDFEPYVSSFSGDQPASVRSPLNF